MVRTYGRQYIVQWDGEAQTFRISLGKESIGAHKTRDGAKAVAVSHARQLSMFAAPEPFAVKFQD